ncbi:hypothetical protein LCGC14_2745970, partial [marine sediment metagenome]
ASVNKQADSFALFTNSPAAASVPAGTCSHLVAESVVVWAEGKCLKDTDGEPIGHMPLILLVPTALSATAAALFSSTEIRNPSATAKYPINNPHVGNFRPVVSRYMGNSNYTGYSATAWNMLASPQELSTVEVCFLNGQQTPIIEQAEANFDTLGVQMRGYFDFGVNDQDGRGGVRSKGAA